MCVEWKFDVSDGFQIEAVSELKGFPGRLYMPE